MILFVFANIFDYEVTTVHCTVIGVSAYYACTVSTFLSNIIPNRKKTVQYLLKRNTEISNISRGHSDLNQGPAGLQPDALPLSYIPRFES